MLRSIGRAVALCLLISACQPPAAESTTQAALPQGDGYDFFVLSLSWSPTHCELEGANADRQQCGTPDRHGFIVHGLWPQYERGWPEFCDSDEPRRVPDAIVRDMIDIMPSAGLIGHQWRKHGSCSGMSQRDYFAVTRAAFDKVAVPQQLDRIADRISITPDEVADAFRVSNPGLLAEGLAVTCSGRHFAEVRICMSKDLGFRRCDNVAARGCSIPRVIVPPGGG